MLIFSIVLFMAIIFIAMIFMMRRIMTQNVIQATKHLDEINQDYAKKEEEMTQRINESMQKYQDLIREAQEEASRIKAQINKEAETEKENTLKQARQQSEEIIQQADKSRESILSELDQRIKKAAVEKACALIQQTLPEQFKQDVHAHWVEELLENSFSNIERLYIPSGLKEVKVVSAFSLSEKVEKKLAKKLHETLGYEVKLKEEVDPKVVAGMIISMGSLVLDGSLKSKIEERVQNSRDIGEP